MRSSKIELKMNRAFFQVFFLIALLNGNLLYAQQDRKYVRQGNKEYSNSKYSDSETLYRKALESNKDSYEWAFNTGDALYKQGKFEDAAKQFEALTERKLTDKQMASVYHNLGNSFLQAQKLPESIDAYKNALRKNPSDMETKYNLAYAMNLLQQQKNQQGNKDNKDNKDKNKDNKKQDKDQNKDQDKDQKNQQNKEQQKQAMSREDAKRLLDALQNDEKQVLDKLKKQQVKSKKVSTKDW
jgi:Ca-activated chloride channel homolog